MRSVTDMSEVEWFKELKFLDILMPASCSCNSFRYILFLTLRRYLPKQLLIIDLTAGLANIQDVAVAAVYTIDQSRRRAGETLTNRENPVLVDTKGCFDYVLTSITVTIVTERRSSFSRSEWKIRFHQHIFQVVRTTIGHWGLRFEDGGSFSVISQDVEVLEDYILD